MPSPSPLRFMVLGLSDYWPVELEKQNGACFMFYKKQGISLIWVFMA
jgi:hypothetical protein